MKKYIIGMAKSHLDTKPGKMRSLQTDFEQLANHIKENDLVEKGYLLVYNDEIAKRVKNWYNKNGITDRELIVLKADSKIGDRLNSILEEKDRNRRGITDQRQPGDSDATISKTIFESILKNEIEKIHACTSVESRTEFLVNWDYVGKIETY